MKKYLQNIKIHKLIHLNIYSYLIIYQPTKLIKHN